MHPSKKDTLMHIPFGGIIPRYLTYRSEWHVTRCVKTACVDRRCAQRTRVQRDEAWREKLRCDVGTATHRRPTPLSIKGTPCYDRSHTVRSRSVDISMQYSCAVRLNLALWHHNATQRSIVASPYVGVRRYIVEEWYVALRHRIRLCTTVRRNHSVATMQRTSYARVALLKVYIHVDFKIYTHNCSTLKFS